MRWTSLVPTTSVLSAVEIPGPAQLPAGFPPNLLDCFFVTLLLQAVLEPDLFAALPTRFFAPFCFLPLALCSLGYRLCGFSDRCRRSFGDCLSCSLGYRSNRVLGHRSCCLGCEISFCSTIGFCGWSGLFSFGFFGVHNETPANALPRLAHAAVASAAKCPECMASVHPANRCPTATQNTNEEMAYGAGSSLEGPPAILMMCG